jgi:hypothetical protein
MLKNRVEVPQQLYADHHHDSVETVRATEILLI